jgi:ribonuclease HI
LPEESNVKVFTDSQSMIETFNELQTKISRKAFTTRKKFKISSNNFLWISLFEIIQKLRISLELFKVKAHDADVYNNRVDYLANAAHLKVDNELLDINYQNIDMLKWIPAWNNIVIEQNIRKFVTLTMNVNNLEKF